MIISKVVYPRALTFLFQAFSFDFTPSKFSPLQMPTKVCFWSQSKDLYFPFNFHYFSSYLVHWIKSYSRSKCLHSNFLNFPVIIFGLSLMICCLMVQTCSNIPFRGTSLDGTCLLGLYRKILILCLDWVYLCAEVALSNPYGVLRGF